MGTETDSTNPNTKILQPDGSFKTAAEVAAAKAAADKAAADKAASDKAAADAAAAKATADAAAAAKAAEEKAAADAAAAAKAAEEKAAADAAASTTTITTASPTKQVTDYIAANPNATSGDIAAKITEVGADIDAVADATGTDRDIARSAFSVASAANTSRTATNTLITNYNNDYGADQGEDGEDPGESDDLVQPLPGIEDGDKVGSSKKPQSFLKDYKAMDVTEYVNRPDVVKVDVEGGITKESAIEQLGVFDKITAPDKVTATQITAATATVKEAIAAGDVEPTDYKAALAQTLNATVPAVGTSRPPITVEEIRKLSQRAQAATMGDTSKGMATTSQFEISDDAFVPEVNAAVITVSPTPEAEAETRRALTTTASSGVNAQITESINYTAAQTRIVKGEEAKGGAAEMIAVTGELPSDVAAAIVEDPATVEAQIDKQPVEIQAAVAALPSEALVSSQMENLLGGMEAGKIPLWARPAVDAVNQQLTIRGMEASTIARDALFNAIVQTALPMAQSNATALQQRAAQNLSNEQQANIQSATLDMNRRMQNLSNQQTAASQTAQMANNMAQLQSQFKQDATILSAQL